MKLTKSKLKQLIKEELALMGALDVEQNFISKHGLNEQDDDDDTYEEKYYGSRTWEQDQDELDRSHAAAERMADEVEAEEAASEGRTAVEAYVSELAAATGRDYNQLMSELEKLFRDYNPIDTLASTMARAKKHAPIKEDA